MSPMRRVAHLQEGLETLGPLSSELTMFLSQEVESLDPERARIFGQILDEVWAARDRVHSLYIDATALV
jgi:hypothetical protein